jgi:hypothetical protein
MQRPTLSALTALSIGCFVFAGAGRIYRGNQRKMRS